MHDHIKKTEKEPYDKVIEGDKPHRFDLRVKLTRQVDRQVVRPGQQPVLVPPPLGHDGDVEAKKEGEVATERAQRLVKVAHDLLERQLLGRRHHASETRRYLSRTNAILKLDLSAV